MLEEINQELISGVMPNGSLELEWSDAPEAITRGGRLLQEEIYRRFLDDADSWLLFLGFCDRGVPLFDSLDYWRSFAELFVKRLSRTPDLEFLRHKAEITIEEDELRRHLEDAPLMTGLDYLNLELLADVWLRLQKTFAGAIKAHKGTVEDFIRSYSPDAHLVGRVFFHLVENKDDNNPFAFLATYSTKLNEQGKSRHLPLKHALQEYGQDSHRLLKLLVTVHQAAEKSPLISELLETGELFHPLAWGSKEAFSFLKEIPVYEDCGILCRIPNWWKGSAATIRLNITIGNQEPSFVGMNALLNFDPQLFLGDAQISEEEANKLLYESEGLAWIKNKWVAVDPEKLWQTLEAYKKAKALAKKGSLSFMEALRLQLRPEKLLGGHDTELELSISISNGKWMESVIQKMTNPQKISLISPDETFKAELREYQHKGVNWLYFLHSLQFGACLADDMGLGKTVEVLAFLHILKSENSKTGIPHRASLLVVPASLIFNWSYEIQRFSPDIRFRVAHPSADADRNASGETPGLPDDFDLVITTYTMAQKYEWLRTYVWNYIILDEAQAIKNPGTKQARALKKLSAQNRIIMTGTPVKNRLSDLWSLFDFLNPGLLGTIKEFKEFSNKLKDNPHVAATLYGVGAMLDNDPSLFFKLRQVEMADLISRAVEDRVHTLLKVSEKKTGRVMDDSSLGAIFGIDMEMGASIEAGMKTKALSTTKETKGKAAQKPKVKSPIESKAKTTVASPHASKSALTGESQAEQILEMVKHTKKGIDAAALKRKTGFDEKKIRNILYSAIKRGDIERIERGIYRGKHSPPVG